MPGPVSRTSDAGKKDPWGDIRPTTSGGQEQVINNKARRIAVNIAELPGLLRKQ
jgi:hypothetical protein